MSLIRHLLSLTPYEETRRQKMELPKRGGCRDADYPQRYVEERH